MRRSKLEQYIDVLKVLKYYGAMRVTHIIYKGNYNLNALTPCLEYLVDKGLVEEQLISKRRGKPIKLYAITKRGIQVLVQFQELSCLLPYDTEIDCLPHNPWGQAVGTQYQKAEVFPR